MLVNIEGLSEEVVATITPGQLVEAATWSLNAAGVTPQWVLGVTHDEILQGDPERFALIALGVALAIMADMEVEEYED